jgi:hypothetical protein
MDGNNMKYHLYWIGEKERIILINRIKEAGYTCLHNEKIIAVFDLKNDVMASLFFIDDPEPEHFGEVCMFYYFNKKMFRTKKIFNLELLLHNIMIDSGAKDYLSMLPQ